MEQQTTDPSFWLGIFSAIGAASAVLFLLWCYARCYKPKREETPLVEWQTFSFPEPEEMDFETYYLLLSQKGSFTRDLAWFLFVQSRAFEQYDVKAMAIDVVKEVWYEEQDA